jgi:hypothetical protein
LDWGLVAALALLVAAADADAAKRSRKKKAAPPVETTAADKRDDKTLCDGGMHCRRSDPWLHGACQIWPAPLR